MFEQLDPLALAGAFRKPDAGSVISFLGGTKLICQIPQKGWMLLHTHTPYFEIGQDMQVTTEPETSKLLFCCMPEPEGEKLSPVFSQEVSVQRVKESHPKN